MRYNLSIFVVRASVAGSGDYERFRAFISCLKFTSSYTIVFSKLQKLKTWDKQKGRFFFNTAQSKLIISLQVLLKLCLFLVEDYYIQVWKKIGRSPILSQFIELDTTRIIICCLPGILRYCIPTAPGNSFETALIISIVIGQLPFILSVPLY